MKNLSVDTLKNLSVDTLNNLSADTLKKINLVSDAEIPNTPLFYTELKKLLDEKTITYKQSTFGDIEEFEDIKLNECNTPMCIAGYHKIAGGKKGFELWKKVGYVNCATLMHLKENPTAPVFNYMSSNNSDGLPYIEMMASFEQRENKDLTFTEWLDLELNKKEN